MSAGAATDHRMIGPGPLVVVVGPSGAGKDTLIVRARTLLADDSTVVFPRRIVTRAASAAEDQHTISARDFAAAAQRDAFAFWWEAHGLKYALPAGIDEDIRAGRIVVCNVSRGIVAALRRRYVRLGVVLVTAPADVRTTRLAMRGRADDGDFAQRIDRMAPPYAELSPDHVIENVGDLERASASLVTAIMAAQAR